jgi:DNA adenine methylase
LLKWSGSKDAVVGKLVAMAPPRFERYHESFLGGGSLFFALRPGRSFLSDLNAELINLYAVVRDEPGLLLEALARHETPARTSRGCAGSIPTRFRPSRARHGRCS